IRERKTTLFTTNQRERQNKKVKNVGFLNSAARSRGSALRILVSVCDLSRTSSEQSPILYNLLISDS
ncbi:MAG: hypothetical protein NUW37_00825, partial [Planctomycetes bacterium]|nr:hypothetical protein [Planctomycetota bacterium]